MTEAGWDERQRRQGKEIEDLENKGQHFHQLEAEERHLRNQAWQSRVRR